MYWNIHPCKSTHQQTKSSKKDNIPTLIQMFKDLFTYRSLRNIKRTSLKLFTNMYKVEYLKC